MRRLHRVTTYTFILGLFTAATAASLQASTAIENSLIQPVQLQGIEPKTYNILDRMKHHEVPGVSLAVFKNGKIVAVKTWGVKDKSTQEAVTPDTLFQAGSISKPVATFAAMHMVEKGLIELDAPINQHLKRWKVPANEFTKKAPVTLARLTNHTAGVTVHGFPGYASDAPYPTIVQILNGEEPANTGTIYVDTEPGTNWRYSGGGYTIMQVAMEDVVGTQFPDLAEQFSLSPAGMSSSSYAQPLPKDKWKTAATGYRNDGNAVVGRFHAYPEMAAAGLWTTPTDLAKFAFMVLDNWNQKPSAILSAELAKKYLTPDLHNWGLGFNLHMEDDKIIGFQHGGSDAGFKAQFTAFLNGDGAVIMTNGDNGGSLAKEILTSIANHYDWPKHRVATQAWRPTTEEEKASLSGRYKWSDEKITTFVTVKPDGDCLVFSNPQYLTPTCFYVTEIQDGTTSLIAQNGRRLSLSFNAEDVPVLNIWGRQAAKE